MSKTLKEFLQRWVISSGTRERDQPDGFEEFVKCRRVNRKPRMHTNEHEFGTKAQSYSRLFVSIRGCNLIGGFTPEILAAPGGFGLLGWLYERHQI